jgi:hypothetical protein
MAERVGFPRVCHRPTPSFCRVVSPGRHGAGIAHLPKSIRNSRDPRRPSPGASKREPPRFMLSFEQEQANQSSTGQFIFADIDKVTSNDVSTIKRRAVWSENERIPVNGNRRQKAAVQWKFERNARRGDHCRVADGRLCTERASRRPVGVIGWIWRQQLTGFRLCRSVSLPLYGCVHRGLLTEDSRISRCSLPFRALSHLAGATLRLRRALAASSRMTVARTTAAMLATVLCVGGCGDPCSARAAGAAVGRSRSWLAPAATRTPRLRRAKRISSGIVCARDYSISG